MAESVPAEAPPNAASLVEWAEDHADRVGVADAEEAGAYEVTVEFEATSLLLMGVLGEDGQPGLWESVSLAHWNGVESEARLQIPEQTSAPPVGVADDESAVTVRTADAEIELSSEGGDEAESAGGAEEASEEDRAEEESGEDRAEAEEE